MSPDISECSTGRKIVMASGSPEGSANSTFLSRSKITGRMLYFKGVGEDIDTDNHSMWPDSNRCKGEYIWVRTSTQAGEFTRRSYLKVPKNQFLHLYCFYKTEEVLIAEIKEINPLDYQTCKLTWNNQPEFGDIITNYTFNSIGWHKIPTGTIGAIVIKYLDDWPPVSGDYGNLFWSSNYSDKDYRPYFTDT